MPNEIPGNAGFLVHTNLAPVTAGVGIPPTTLGRAMRPNTAVPLLEQSAFQAWGRGTWDLDEPNIPPADIRFTRGPRLSGVRGTLDLWMELGLDGTARTVCYLTDNPAAPTRVIALRVDSQNRSLLTMNYGVLDPVPAGGILDMSGGNATNLETVVINGKTYTWEASLTNVDGHVKVGTTTAQSINNLIAAINLGSGKGTAYATATTLHPTVRAEIGPIPSSVAVEAKQVGTVGNAITTTETMLNGFWVNGATLVDGADGDLTTVGEISPTGPPAMPNVLPGGEAHVRMTWDTVNPIPGHLRHMTFSYNGQHVAAGNWSTDPTAPWGYWQPTHLVLGAGLVDLALEADFNGVIRAVQVSNLVLP